MSICRQSSETFDEYDEAQWWANLIDRVGIDEALKVIEAKRDTGSGAVLLTDWLTRYANRLTGVQEDGRRKYHSYIRNEITPFFGERAPIDAGTQDTDAAWIVYLEQDKGNRPKTIKNKHGFLSAGLRAAVEQRPAPTALLVGPALKVVRCQKPRPMRHFLDSSPTLHRHARYLGCRQRISVRGERRTAHRRDASPFTVTAPDGLRLSAARLGPKRPPASVVYVHTILTDSTYWRPLTEHLHQRLDSGIAQLVYDQRTHGASRHPGPGVRTTLPMLVDDLDAVLTHAHGAVILVAHSVASLLVQAWAEQYPHRARTLTGIVLFNGCPEFPWRPTPDAIHADGRRSRRAGRQLLEELTTYLFEPPVRCRLPRRRLFDTVGSGTRSENFDAMLADLAAYSGAALTGEAASILRGVPTWVLTGPLDPVVAPSRSQHMAERIWGDYDSFPDAGHSLPYAEPAKACGPILAALEVAYRTQQQHGGPL
ncbi:alpha/beta hydrolase [Nocardia sp. NBC_01730]|uniref:alpha/beta fold hydrolase n=1 Tax=Nocardia sp. NBC_01730 TaxID=2975998 RepID=UPI002E13D635|nr:alpha/beta hydrolase [Nocardia sp. NBC_01730]